MDIRAAREEDLSRLTEIYNWAILNTTATFDIEPQSVDARKPWFFQHTGKHPLIVAEYDGKVVGYSSLSRFREKQAYERTVELSVYVHPSYWNKGVGTALMKKILDMAAELGHHTVVSGITAGNDTSIRMHQKLGFKFCGCFKEVGFKFGQWQDVVFYQLRIG